MVLPASRSLRRTRRTVSSVTRVSTSASNPHTFESSVSRETLLSKVWGFNAEVETRVTDETVRRVRRKLREAGSATQIKAVWGYGYKLEASS